VGTWVWVQRTSYRAGGTTRTGEEGGRGDIEELHAIITNRHSLFWVYDTIN